MSCGKNSKRGTPQGGVVSPLLSVVYMNRFLKHWRLTGRGEAFRAHVVSYADDFVSRSSAVGSSTSIIWIAASFSSTAFGVSPGASAFNRCLSVTIRQ